LSGSFLPPPSGLQPGGSSPQSPGSFSVCTLQVSGGTVNGHGCS
jgi:hypothetical protein